MSTTPDDWDQFGPPREPRPKPKVTKKPEAKQCACDWTAFCPVHSKDGKPAYPFDPQSYEAS